MYFSEEGIQGIRVHLRKTSWISMIQGLVCLVFGLWTAVSPSGSIAAFLVLIGGFILLNGLMQAVSAVAAARHDRLWYAGLGAALVQILLAVFILSKSRAISEFAIMLSTVGLGIVGVISGAVSIIAAVRYRDAVDNVSAWLSRGALFFVIGIAMLIAPFGFGTAMVRTVGVLASVFGIVQIWGAVKLFKETGEGSNGSV